MSRTALSRLLGVVSILLLTLAAASCSNEIDGPVQRAQTDVDNVAPYGPGAKVGETYDYVLYTHCGIEWTRIDGLWWRTTVRGDDGNPPSGWGNPYDAGRLVIVDQDSATYSGGPGDDITFERTSLAEAPFHCA